MNHFHRCVLENRAGVAFGAARGAYWFVGTRRAVTGGHGRRRHALRVIGPPLVGTSLPGPRRGRSDAVRFSSRRRRQAVDELAALGEAASPPSRGPLKAWGSSARDLLLRIVHCLR